MKFAAAILACYLAQATAEFVYPTTYSTDDLAKKRENCVELHNIPKWELFRGNTYQFFTDDKLRCYMRCFLSELNVMKQSGEFDPTALTAIAGRLFEYSIYTCAANVKSNAEPRDFAYNLLKCFYHYNPEILTRIGVIYPGP